MKKAIALPLALLLVGLCACEQVAPEKPAPSEETFEFETVSIPTTTESSATEKPMTTTLLSSTIRVGEETPYSHFLNGFAKRHHDQLEYDYYAFYDMDGNGTRELLLAENGPYTANRMTIYSVYTIQNGVAVHQEEYQMVPEFNPPPILYKNGVLMWEDNREKEGPFSFYYYRFQDGTLKFQLELFDYSGKYYRRDKQGSTFDLDNPIITPSPKKNSTACKKKWKAMGRWLTSTGNRWRSTCPRANQTSPPSSRTGSTPLPGPAQTRRGGSATRASR